MFDAYRVVARARHLAGGMQKQAAGGIANDYIGAGLTAAIPVVGPVATMVGGITGLAQGKPDEDELDKMDRRPALSYLPGVGAARIVRKSLDAVQNDHPRGTVLSEAAGTLLHSLIGGIAGGVAGAAAGMKKYPSRMPKLTASGIAAGAMLGAAPQVLGALIGTARKRRTESEQAEADARHSMTKAFLLPGYAGYASARRAASAVRREDERNRRAEEKQNKSKKEDAK